MGIWLDENMMRCISLDSVKTPCMCLLTVEKDRMDRMSNSMFYSSVSFTVTVWTRPFQMKANHRALLARVQELDRFVAL